MSSNGRSRCIARPAVPPCGRPVHDRPITFDGGDLHRTRLDGLTGARIWCGYGVLAHNLNKITTLATANT